VSRACPGVALIVPAPVPCRYRFYPAICSNSSKLPAAPATTRPASPKFPDVPTYEFECQCGHKEDRVISIRQAPPLGVREPCPRCRDITLERALSVPTIADAALRATIKGYPYVSRRHQGLPGCRETTDGHPIIESQSHEREVMAQTGMVRE
jgi:predicted nucleic acid-binding Zn ribbon protein